MYKKNCAYEYLYNNNNEVKDTLLLQSATSSAVQQIWLSED